VTETALADRTTSVGACELTILMPCLNEARTIGTCIAKAQSFLREHGVNGEVLVADNGSDDGSQQIALGLGARVVAVPQRGYGAALIHGIAAAHGRYVIMGDSDDSYDFTALAPFLEKLREGYDLVMGNRFLGGIKPGAMPPLHRYLGNPVLSAVGRIFFHSPCGDFHCGLRGFRRDAMIALDLQATGMEFASEMVVKSTIHKLRITEVPTTLSPDGRDRPPHLRSWRDGWRHLRFLLLFSPRWLFLYPGAAIAAIGLIGMAWLLPGARQIGDVVLDIHTLAYAALMVNIGVQAMFFWVFAKLYGAREGLVPPDPAFTRVLHAVSLEACLLIALALFVGGVALGVFALGQWGAGQFGPLAPQETMRLIIPSAAAILLAFQIAYGAFFVGVLDIRSLRSRALDAAKGQR
jgi:glycosyltransferase involved in cell wall biosynthesis